MAKDHGSSVKNDKQYEGLRKKGMSKARAAAISNSEGSSSRGGKSSGSSQSRQSSGSGSGGNRAQKAAAGRKCGKNWQLARGASAGTDSRMCRCVSRAVRS
jgi:hypothetical protein